MDIEKYIQRAKETQDEHENLCRRCGKCCEAGSDQCAKLMPQSDGNYLCADYDNRLGKQIIIGGSEFTCVQIRDHVALGYKIAGCPYFSVIFQ